MKENIIVFALISFIPFSISFSQLNIQHHYDIGRDIQTSTVEYFGTDKLGSTYFFIDLNYDKKGASDAYYEIARYFYLPFSKQISFSVQYNDGIQYALGQDGILPLINRIWLTGVQYSLQAGKINLPMDFLVKYNYMDTRPTFQFTVVWMQLLFGKHLWTSGVLDIWSNDTSRKAFHSKEKISMQAEIQIYYEMHRFAVGSEFEIDRSFNGAWTKKYAYYKVNGEPRYKRIFIIPTIFIKWIL